MLPNLWLRFMRLVFGPRPVERPEAVRLPANDTWSRKARLQPEGIAPWNPEDGEES